jgi:hypothetical protein
VLTAATLDRNVVPALLLIPVSSSNVVPELLF